MRTNISIALIIAGMALGSAGVENQPATSEVAAIKLSGTRTEKQPQTVVEEQPEEKPKESKITIDFTGDEVKVTDTDNLGVKVFDATGNKVADSAEPPAPEATQEPQYQLLLFSASWCGPCKSLKSAIHAANIPMEGDGSEVVWVVDIDDFPKAKREWRVGSIPTMVLCKKEGGKLTEVRRKVGAMSKEIFEMNFPELLPIQKQEVSSSPVRKRLCGCDGNTPGCCMCLQEIKAGIRTKPCGCTASKSSEHFIDENDRPIGATGRYVQTHTITATGQGPGGKWCATCRRYH